MQKLNIDENGWCPQARQIASPNCDARPDCALELVVIHNISLPPNQFGGDGVLQLFTNQLDPSVHPYYAEIHQLKVSAHFFIRRNGELIQFVSCNQRAWHAGVSEWQGRSRCNDFSLGIELEGSDEQAFEPIQYKILQNLLAAIRAKYPIQALVGHSDIAPGRKTDPGPFFDWQMLQDESGLDRHR
jgi:N-acetyl-anhydromuramoyl-L-alanine amidase